MRSSLCALNAATGDNLTMNYPDYDQAIKELRVKKLSINLYYQFTAQLRSRKTFSFNQRHWGEQFVIL